MPAASESPPAPGHPPRRHRRRRRVWVCVGSLLLLAVVAAVVVTRPAVLTPLLRTQLAAALKAEVELDRATLSPVGVLRLRGLSVSLPPDAEGPVLAGTEGRADFARLLDIDELTLRVGKRELLRGRVDLRRVEVDGPTLHAVVDARGGRSNLRVWADRFSGEPDPDAPPRPVTLPPAIAIRDARLDLVELREDAAGGYAEAGRRVLPFDGRVIPSGEAADASLAFELVGGVAAGATTRGSNLEGRWTPSTQELVVKVERVDLGSPLGLLMPEGVRSFWRDLDPAGALPALTLSTRLDRRGSDRVRRARLEVEGLSFRLPLESLDLLPEGERAEEAPRMSGVSGAVEVAEGRLRTDGLTGEIEGIRVRIRGDGVARRGRPGGAHRRDRPLRGAGRAAAALPPGRGRSRRCTASTGRRAASPPPSASTARRGSRWRWTVASTSSTPARCSHAFAYPVEGLTGRLLFERDRFELQSLAGEGPDGGRVVLDGVVTEPGEHAGIDLSIRVSEVPVDETLLEAIDPPLRAIIGDFFSGDTATRLAADRPAAGLTEGFAPGGLLNGEVRVLRDTDVRPKSWVELDLDPEGLRVMMPAFAYPLTIRSGRLRAGPEEVRVERLVATGPTGGAGVVSGRVGLGEPDAPPRDRPAPLRDVAADRRPPAGRARRRGGRVAAPPRPPRADRRRRPHRWRGRWRPGRGSARPRAGPPPRGRVDGALGRRAAAAAGRRGGADRPVLGADRPRGGGLADRRRVGGRGPHRDRRRPPPPRLRGAGRRL